MARVRRRCHIVCEERVQALELREGEVVERASPVLGHLHGTAGDVVRLPEGDSLADEVPGWREDVGAG